MIYLNKPQYTETYGGREFLWDSQMGGGEFNKMVKNDVKKSIKKHTFRAKSCCSTVVTRLIWGFKFAI